MFSYEAISQLQNMSKLCVYCRHFSFISYLHLYGHLSQFKVLRQLQLDCYRPIASDVDISYPCNRECI